MNIDERYPSFDIWLKQCQENPMFKGADFSRLSLIRSFYKERIAFGPSPDLRRVWEKELATRLCAKNL